MTAEDEAEDNGEQRWREKIFRGNPRLLLRAFHREKRWVGGLVRASCGSSGSASGVPRGDT